jgi:serine/threonine protein kinase
MVELAEALQRLSKDPKFKHHGDVKPENIVVTKSGIKLIDPGHFGPLDCAEGNLNRCVVTTPAYYPLLTPDDLFAMGIILWEIACRSHPMDGVAYSGAIDKSNLGQGLVDWVRGRELVGQYYLSPILGVRRPSDLRSDMPGALENVLLKALRLRINPDNKFDKDAGFASLADLASALRNVIAEGVRQL